ncbi:MAG TPA: hypothetical protein GX726_05560 [Clostridiales bacterium]|jgi:uncharacterized protein with PIN domain|nr:hypothetical protein [Clostridiales bacterium]
MEEKPTLICSRCQLELEEAEAQFSYLNSSMRHKVKRCPSCGQVYLPESLVTGRMRELEDALEEK